MAYTPEQADYLHDIGLMPTRYWVMQNGRSPEYNWEYQKREMYKWIEDNERKKKREEAKKKIEQQILDAIVYTMSQGSDLVADAAADEVINTVNAAFGGGSVDSNGKRSFSADLGAILGKALGEAPFKLLDEIFEEDERSRRR